LLQLTNLHLAADAVGVELLQHAHDALRGSRVPEVVRHQQAPVPIRFRVGLRVHLAESHRRIDVLALVVDAQIKLEVRPIWGHRLEYLLEVTSQAHSRSVPA
jgi:hypothetical protein